MTSNRKGVKPFIKSSVWEKNIRRGGEHIRGQLWEPIRNHTCLYVYFYFCSLSLPKCLQQVPFLACYRDNLIWMECTSLVMLFWEGYLESTFTQHFLNYPLLQNQRTPSAMGDCFDEDIFRKKIDTLIIIQ